MGEPEMAANGSVDGEKWSVHSALTDNGFYPPTTPSTKSPVQFFHLLGRLKTTRRQGWLDYGLQDVESIADHMYRMSIITMLCPRSLVEKLDINVSRCTKMALVHDMAESLVGDLTPSQKEQIEAQYGKGEKSRREGAVMQYVGNIMLGNVEGGQKGNEPGDAGKDLITAWQEYEDSKTNDSKFVHDVDKIELLLQMVEYEREGKGRLDLRDFVEVASRIQLQEVRDWWEELERERVDMWKKF